MPIQYDYIGEFLEGLAIAQQNYKRGYIDNTGNIVIPIQYDYAWDFKNGKAPVRLNGEIFHIDKTGKRID